jgi:hypothetical protein
MGHAVGHAYGPFRTAGGRFGTAPRLVVCSVVSFPLATRAREVVSGLDSRLYMKTTVTAMTAKPTIA